MTSPFYYASMRGFTGVAFVGCVHTVTPELTSRLDRLLEYVSAFQNFALVFGGDLSSSKLLDDMKKHFYDAKRGIPGNIESFMALVEKNGGTYAIRSIDDWLNIVQRQEYIGPWIGEYCSDACRKAIEQGFIDNTESICQMAQKFRDRGARVMVCGGNWEDVESSRKTMGMPNIPDHVPRLREMGVEVFTQIGHALVGNVDLVFLPYWEMAKLDEQSIERLRVVGRCKGGIEPLIAVAHAEPNWAVHNKMNPAVSPERAAIIANLGFCLAQLGPDQVVYPHQHDQIKSADGYALGDNVKYLLRIQDKTVSLIEDPKTVEKLAKDVIVASFVPFQKVALLSTEDSDNHTLRIFGGEGKLIEVLSM